MSAPRLLPEEERKVVFTRYFLAMEEHGHDVVKLELDFMTLTCLVAAVQLACRHQGYTGPARQIVEDWTRQTVAAMPEDVRVALELGFDARYDQPWGEAKGGDPC